jgi:hypothetical protein
MVRADRALALRTWNPKYTPVFLACSRADVLDIIVRSRSRYLVTYCPSGPRGYRSQEEMVLAHETAQSSPDLFELVAEFPWALQYVRGHRSVSEMFDLLANSPLGIEEREIRHGRIFVWEFLGELPEGPSELPIRIPTADLLLGAGGEIPAGPPPGPRAGKGPAKPTE